MLQAHADTKRWQERVTQLTTRHKSVDKEEYDRVGQLLQEARAELAKSKVDAESAAELQSNRVSELEGQLVQVSLHQLQALPACCYGSFRLLAFIFAPN